MSFPGRQSWVLLLLIVLLALVVRRIAPARLARLTGWSEGPALPILAGILAASLTLWQWGGLRAVPVIHDEAAYLLQADLFAKGHWAQPSPPAAEAFTQPAVLVTPVLAPKMPPGHALLLIPGMLLHAPGLMPMLLVGATAALLALLVRRLAGASAAILSLVLWLTQGGQARWRASYFSENTTTLLWLLGWWALWRWRDSGRTRWLLLVAAATGWGAITRPLTMLVFAIPVGIVVLIDVVRTRRWAQLGWAMALGTLVLMLVPLQNRMTLGRWNRSPLTLYTRQYIPFDKVGFGLDTTPPEFTMPGPLVRGNDRFIALHREHQPAALPRILQGRLRVWFSANFGVWRRLFVPLAILALCFLPRAAWLGVASWAGLYLAYLGYAHEPAWALYYAEATTVSAAVIGIGLAWWLFSAVGGARSTAMGVLVAALIFCWAIPDLQRWHDAIREPQRPEQEFRASVEALSPGKSLVFLRYSATHDPHTSFLRNVADPVDAPLITAFDLGPESRASIRAAFPDRSAFVWDEATHQFTPENR
ncbi:MAG: glycosyltransferase family 39 protein [Gemmatimonadales bacterium]